MSAKREYEFAVWCKAEEIVPFFKTLTGLGYTWASGASLLDQFGKPASRIAERNCSFHATYDKMLRWSDKSTLKAARTASNELNPEHPIITYEEFVNNGNYFLPIEFSDIDIMSVL